VYFPCNSHWGLALDAHKAPRFEDTLRRIIREELKSSAA
jgi:hypothetical protein